MTDHPAPNPNRGESMSATTTYQMTHAQAADAMTMWWDDTLWLPFVEGESADITGPGHQDPVAFAAAVTLYDRTASADPNATATDPADVSHRWIIATYDGEEVGEWYAKTVTADTDGAIPVTTIWDVR